jgi:haloalkane dehalogenase
MSAARVPVLFLHGNPTSSYLRCDVIGELEGRGRLLAPDLIGMDDSAKLPNPGLDTYRFTTHRKYLAGFIDAVIGPDEPVTFVIHDWGSALGFDWANHHRDRVRGITYMEAIVRPVTGWEEWSAAATPIFQGFRSDKGESMILERNMFVERVLPGSVLRKLSEAEMAEYRKPYPTAEDRWPTLTWPRQVPIAGEPVEVVQIASDYAQWMVRNEIPKLFVNAKPGAILIGPVREFCRSWKN